MKKYSIPTEYQDQLRYVEPSDKRSDVEILSSLNQHVPVTSEKNIWAYWHAGLQGMSAWCQRNVVGWVKINPGWQIRVLDPIPNSPNYALKFVSPEMLPETFVKGTMDGPYTGPHSADFLRGALPYLHGGVFMDVGIMLFRSIDRICWAQLSDPASPFQVSVPHMRETSMANHFVACRKGDPFIKRWHDLFIYLWKGHTNYEGLIQSPLLAFALSRDLSEFQRRFKWDFSAEPRTIFQYVAQVLAFTRLTRLEEAGDGFSCVDYAVNNIIWFDALEEDWASETVVGWRGQDAVDALAVRLDANPDSGEFKIAHQNVWRMLTKSSMQKIAHGKNLTKTPCWGLIWDQEGNEEKDIEPGTFAELLRYGAVHFEQLRESIEYVKIEKPETMKKGVFEP